MISADKHFLCLEMLSVYVLSYSVLVYRIRIAKCFANSDKRFWREVMFENEDTVFPSAQFLRYWHEQRPSKCGDLDSNAVGEVGRVYYTGVSGLASDSTCTLARDCYCVAL
jgi:hypothetical protein